MDELKANSRNSAKQKNHQSLNWLTIHPHATASAALAGWFEEETGIKLQITTVPYAEITDAALLDVSSKQPSFDLFQFWYPMIGHLARLQALRDLTQWWDATSPIIDVDDLIPVFRDGWCVSNGHRFGIPLDGDMHLLFYNKSIFERHDIKVPVTWDEYLAIARKITTLEGEKGVFGCGIMGADIPLILIGTFINRLASFGGDLIDSSGKPTINSELAVSALEHMLSEIPFALPEPYRVAFDEMLAPWLNGQVGMVEFWADLGKISDGPGSKMAGQWGVAPLPVGPQPFGKTVAPLNAGWCLGISARSRNEVLARKFLEFCLRPQTILKICTIQGGFDPIRWSTYANPEFRACVTEDLADAACNAIRSSAVPWPTDYRWSILQSSLHNQLYQSVCGQISPRRALDTVQTAWTEILAED